MVLEAHSRKVLGDNKECLLSHSVRKLIANMEEVDAPILINLIK